MNAAPNIIGGCHNDQQQRDPGVKHAMTSMTVNRCCLRTQQALLGKRAQEQDSQHGRMAATITTAVAPRLMPCCAMPSDLYLHCLAQHSCITSTDLP